MEEKTVFRSEVSYDLATYRDFVRINTYTIPRVTFCGLLYVACMTYLLSQLENSFAAKAVLVLSLFALGLWAFQWYRNRDGGIQYKRMLRDNKDEIPHYQITVEEGGITIQNLSTGNERSGSFANIRQILESNRLLILVDDLKIAYTIDKTTLTGGSREELISFLHRHCPQLKKRVHNGTLGRIVWYLIRILPILMLLMSLAALFQAHQTTRGQISGSLSYQEIADELRPLGIDISQTVIEELNRYDAENSGFALPDIATKSLNLLCWEGQGRYEKNVFYQEGPVEAYDWTWTPSTSGVYWFDLEVMDVSAMYSDFLKGVSAMDSSLSFTNVAEDYSNFDMFAGSGEIGFSFDYLGEHYTFSAECHDDWFDTDMLYHLGRILAADEDPKDLWMTLDGQGVLLYYGTEESKDLLVRKTGIDFFDCVTMRMGH